MSIRGNGFLNKNLHYSIVSEFLSHLQVRFFYFDSLEFPSFLFVVQLEKRWGFRFRISTSRSDSADDGLGLNGVHQVRAPLEIPDERLSVIGDVPEEGALGCRWR